MKRYILPHLFLAYIAILLSSSSGFALHNTEDRDRPSSSVSDANAKGDRYLMAGVGTFLNDKEWSWGAPHQDGIGSIRFDLTYRINEWEHATDLWFRLQYLHYNLTGGGAGQISMLPIIAFPSTRTSYPMYFGIGLGPGFFLNQVSKAGYLAVNYAAMTGVRFPNLFGRNNGLYMEVGYQGLVNLLSVGQQQGVYLAAGGIFLF